MEEQRSKPASAVETGGVRSVLHYLASSKAAIALTFLLLLLVLVEVASSGFRKSFSNKYPFTVGVISSFLFIALGAVAVERYLQEREEQRQREELERERAEWDLIARKIFRELRHALGAPSLDLIGAELALAEIEDGKRERDLDAIAKPIEEALAPVEAVLLERFPVMVLRPELVEAARVAEEAVTAAEVAASIVREWDFEELDRSMLGWAGEVLSDREEWFRDREQAISREEAEQHEAELTEALKALRLPGS